MPDDSDVADEAATEFPVSPPIYVERYASHVSLSWQAGDLDRFLGTVTDLDSVPADPAFVVDATNAAGQRRIPLSDIDTTTRATTYVRVDPDTPWTVAWERRTTPVVSLSGAPTALACRRLHHGTTDCEQWPAGQLQTLSRLLDDDS